MVTVRTSAAIKNQSLPCNTTVSTVRGTVPPQSSSQQALLGSCGTPAKSNLASEKSIPKSNPVSDRELKSTTVLSGAQIVSRSNTGSQLKIAQAKNVVDTALPAGSSLTKTSNSAGFSSDQKVHLNVFVHHVLVY